MVQRPLEVTCTRGLRLNVLDLTVSLNDQYQNNVLCKRGICSTATRGHIVHYSDCRASPNLAACTFGDYLFEALDEASSKTTDYH